MGQQIRVCQCNVLIPANAPRKTRVQILRPSPGIDQRQIGICTRLGRYSIMICASARLSFPHVFDPRVQKKKTQNPHVHTVKTNNDSLSHVLFEPHPLNIVIPVAFFLPFLPAICQSSSIIVFGYMTSRADDPKVLNRACLPYEQKAKQKLKGLLRGRDALIIAKLVSRGLADSASR